MTTSAVVGVQALACLGSPFPDTLKRELQRRPKPHGERRFGTPDYGRDRARASRRREYPPPRHLNAARCRRFARRRRENPVRPRHCRNPDEARARFRRPTFSVDHGADAGAARWLGATAPAASRDRRAGRSRCRRACAIGRRNWRRAETLGIAFARSALQSQALEWSADKLKLELQLVDNAVAAPETSGNRRWNESKGDSGG